ncbi:MAG: glycosyltransferase family 1 protein [Microgenomates group bacterium]
MNIGIDARLIGETGIGRYIRNLITELAAIDQTNTYVIFLPKDGFDTFIPPNIRWKKRVCAVHWHTLQEQLVMPWIFLSEHLDLLHVPYFNAPIFYPKPYIITIHDLTILHVTTGKATTLPRPLYFLRKIGYQIIVRLGIMRAKHVIAVSKSTKDDIVKSLGTNPKKISVTYEGVDKQIMSANTASPNKKPYFLYVGNAYPHKNLEFLIRSFGTFIIRHPNYQLVLVGKNDFFYSRLKKWVLQFPWASQIVFVESVSDEQLAAYYTHAAAFVFPSHMEGFGLPALEAIGFGTPVAVSDIPVFHELFATIPLYFDPSKEESLIAVMEAITAGKKKKISDLEKKLISKYQWENTAKETLRVYTAL